MKCSSSPRGFALVATLAILVVVTIFLVAFATTMRTERAASQNFVDRDQAESIGMGMVDRILAEHASPLGLDGERVQPFTLDPDNYSSQTGLPNAATATNYYAATSNSATNGPNVPIPDATQRAALRPIYQMIPDNEAVFEQTGLIRTSKAAGGGGGPAYDSRFWAYDGMAEVPLAQPAVVPEWVDYYQPDDPATSVDESAAPVAQVAFAIWDEGGKFDVNMAGEDPSINGIAPHNLKIEDLVSENKTGLLDYLNGREGADPDKRNRSNFSLRSIVSTFNPVTGRTDDKGNDRWAFSVRELVERGYVNPNAIRFVTTVSRDFDVRPEWDGDRRPRFLRTGSTLGSESFLRSYINNPALFGLFYGSNGVGPQLVRNVLNEKTLSDELTRLGGNLVPRPSDSAEDKADWMQVMRLLAVLRRGLPSPSTGWNTIPQNNTKTFFNEWFVNDIWGIGQNIVQATDAASDYNLISYDPTVSSNYPYRDPNARVGIRISPYIVEATIMVQKTQNGEYNIANYIKLWNPFPFKLKHNGQDILYRVGIHTGSQWPNNNYSGIYDMWSYGNSPGSLMQNIKAPDPGKFKVVKFTRSNVPADQIAKITNPGNKYFRLRPFLQDMDYSSPIGSWKVNGTPESPYQLIQMPGFSFNSTNSADNPNQLIADLSDVPQMTNNSIKWYSFQIDDPRMGSMRRNVASVPTTSIPVNGFPGRSTEHKWSWNLLPTHSLWGCPIVANNDVDITSQETEVKNDASYQGKTFTVNGQPVSGYNKFFGISWPGAPDTGITSQEMFAKAMATFALPGRPFLNIGELGTVFALRPWVTLNFADKIVPRAAGTTNPAIPDAPSDNPALMRPAAILDYFTTIGTPQSMDFTNLHPAYDDRLRFMPEGVGFGNGERPAAGASAFIQTNLNGRYQDKTWLFETVAGTVRDQTIRGNIRPIRGRVNLNTASTELLTAILKAPYRMPASLGLKLSSSSFKEITDIKGNPLSNSNTEDATDYLVTINEADARAMAEAITLPITDSRAIRPLRMLSDLSQLYDRNNALMTDLYGRYPQSVITAMIGRLAQFGTVRQQCYTVDMLVRTLNPRASQAGTKVITGEARLQARVFFDTFSRKAFVESVQYR